MERADSSQSTFGLIEEEEKEQEEDQQPNA
jgi:hypothetical protein